MEELVPIKKMVAGISCGLVTGEEDEDYVLLTDIQGLEDFFGDMDFKVAGTKNGITAIQMDLKIDGLTPEIIKAAFAAFLRSSSQHTGMQKTLIPVFSPRATSVLNTCSAGMPIAAAA